nr:related to immediate-early protein [imported] - Neurospora crassa [Neurospora crassa]
MYVISFGPEAEAWLGFWAFVQAPKLLSKAGELELFRWSTLRFMEGPRGATGGNLRNWRGSEGRSAGARGGEACCPFRIRVLSASQRPDSSLALQGRSWSAQQAPSSRLRPFAGPAVQSLPVQAALLRRAPRDAGWHSPASMDPVSPPHRAAQVSNEPPHVHHQSALIACPVHLSESSLPWLGRDWRRDCSFVSTYSLSLLDRIANIITNSTL